jgi:hypothetical protein
MEMSKNNLMYWEKVREVPKEAQKPIKGGRLSGMTDINPVWRMKTLTEQFGPVGIGWTYEIMDQWIEEGSENQKVALCNIELFIKIDGEWSRGIPGTGGSMLVTNEKSGPRTNDEAFKMALTDAISVSCKALGVGADIYWSNDRSKYDNNSNGNGDKDKDDNGDGGKKRSLSDKQIARLYAIANSKGIDKATVKKQIDTKFKKDVKDLSKAEYDKVCEGYEGLPDKKE